MDRNSEEAESRQTAWPQGLAHSCFWVRTTTLAKLAPGHKWTAGWQPSETRVGGAPSERVPW